MHRLFFKYFFHLSTPLKPMVFDSMFSFGTGGGVTCCSHTRIILILASAEGSKLILTEGNFPSPSSQDGIVVGAVGAYDWNGGVLKETRQGKVVPPKSSYADEFPEELKNHGAYLGESQLPGVGTRARRVDDKAGTKSSVVG